MTNSALQQQSKYVQNLKSRNFNFGLTVGAAFVRGIRDIGYKHTGTALDEQIDNSYQAGADQVHVIFGYAGAASKNKPSELAVLDNAHGMEPDMIRASMTWGGTHREDDRSGFGRYGYGLPSSAISQGHRYTVYSKIDKGDVWAVTIDIDDISNSAHKNLGNVTVVPEARKAKLPTFVAQYIDENLDGEWSQGTVVVMEKLDRIDRTTTKGLHGFLMDHFGVTYHKLRDRFNILVNGESVQPIDPLFLTPGYRYYDLDEQRAEALEPIIIDVKAPGTKDVKGKLTVRMSYMPPDFASIDKLQAAKGKNANERWAIMNKYHGFIFSRSDRIIDVVTRNPLTAIMNNDRYIKIEIDFPAELDEEFNISTSKQRVDVSDKIWDSMREGGLLKAIEQLRKKATKGRATLKNLREQDRNKKRASEDAMERTAQMTDAKPSRDDTERRESRGQTGLEREAARRASQTGQNVQIARRDLELEVKDHGYKVTFDSADGAPFFRIEQLGGAKVLFINKASRFFQEIHSGPKSTPDVRAALELLLFSIGDRMMEADDTRQEWYRYETGEWSKKMELALSQLSQQVGGGPDDDDADEEGAASA